MMRPSIGLAIWLPSHRRRFVLPAPAKIRCHPAGNRPTDSRPSNWVCVGDRVAGGVPLPGQASSPVVGAGNLQHG